MEVEVAADLITSDEESSAALVRRSSKAKSVMNFREDGSNRTVKRESENNRDSVAASDEKPLGAQVRGSLMADSDNNIQENGAKRALMWKTETNDKLSVIMNRDVGEAEKLVQYAEKRTGGEGFEAAKVKVTKRSELIKSGQTVNSKSINEGSNGYSPYSSVEPSSASEVTAMPFDSPHSKVASETSVYFAEKEVRNGDLTINKEEGKAGNGGFKQHQHGISVSESARQNSHNSALNEQDERKLKEYWNRILEISEFEGNVEAIVKIVKEQQSHDLVCPACNSCITERVILRKRKRTNVLDSEGEHDVAENQNDQEERLNEDGEAYGCLACFSLFFRRGVKLFATKSDSAKSQSGSGSLSEPYTSEVHEESAQFIDRKESFHCLPFIYAWGQSKKKASSSGDQLKESLLGESKDDTGLSISLDESSSSRGLHSDRYSTGPKLLGATDDFTTETSQVQHIKAAECIGKSSGSTLIHDGVNATKVDVVGLNEDKPSSKYGKFESQLNLGAIHSKNHVQEFATTITSQRTSNSAITIQNMTFEASPAADKSQMDATSTKNIIVEAIYTSTEATKSAVSVKGKNEFSPSAKVESESSPQSEEFHFITEGQLVQPPSDISGGLDDEIQQDVGKNKALNESPPVNQLEKQPLYQEDAKGTEDQRSVLHFNESVKPLQMPPPEIEASSNEDGIRPDLALKDQVLNNSSTALGIGGLPTPEEEPESFKEATTLRQRESGSKDKSGETGICSCIPVSIPAVWSIWSTKKSPTDELKKPLLYKVGDGTFDKVVPETSKDAYEEVISALKSGSTSSSCLKTRDHANIAQSKVDVLPSDGAVETVIEIKEASDPQSSNSATVASESQNPSSQVEGSSVATEWDLLKSIVYGGLTVSITSLGVVSSAAGGDAKTSTVIAIGLAHLVSGLFLVFNNILDLIQHHQEQFIETVGHSFWFNGFVAIFSYLVFGSLAPVTYGFSFQKTDDKLYKFLGASIVSLVSIILLALGKARVTKKSYIIVTILYIITGFWASVIGFFAGEYIKKLLEK